MTMVNLPLMVVVAVIAACLGYGVVAGLLWLCGWYFDRRDARTLARLLAIGSSWTVVASVGATAFWVVGYNSMDIELIGVVVLASVPAQVLAPLGYSLFAWGLSGDGDATHENDVDVGRDA